MLWVERLDACVSIGGFHRQCLDAIFSNKVMDSPRWAVRTKSSFAREHVLVTVRGEA